MTFAMTICDPGFASSNVAGTRAAAVAPRDRAEPTAPSTLAARMRAAIAGDEAQYSSLLGDIARLARHVARRLLAQYNYGDAIVDDIVQETLIAVHLNRAAWDGDRPVEPWAATMARNKTIDAMRKARPGRETHFEGLEDELAAPAQPETGLRLDVERLLAGLPPRQKDIVVSTALRGESIEQVASRLSMSNAAVRVAKHRAIGEMARAAGMERRPAKSVGCTPPRGASSVARRVNPHSSNATFS